MSPRLVTNIFRIDGFSTVTWMRLVCTKDIQEVSSLREQKVRTLTAIHSQLQDTGSLSALSWTLTHLQEGEPSLWLFYPGGVQFISRPQIATLEVAEEGSWKCSDGGEHIGAIFFQALGAQAQRALAKAGYVQFGHMMVKCKTSAPMAAVPTSRPSLPSLELHFIASSCAVYLAVFCSRRYVRPLAESDLQQCCKGDSMQEVLVGPYGWVGALRRKCSGELVTHLQLAQESSREHCVSLTANSYLSGDYDSVYVEVELLQPGSGFGNSSGDHGLQGKHVIVQGEEVIVPLWPPPISNNFIPSVQGSSGRQEEWNKAYLSRLLRAMASSWANSQVNVSTASQTLQNLQKRAHERRSAVSSAAGSSSKGNSNSSGSNSLEGEDGGQTDDSHGDDRVKRPAQSLLGEAKRPRNVLATGLTPKSEDALTRETQNNLKQLQSPDFSEVPSSIAPFRHWRNSADMAWSFSHQSSPFQTGGTELDDMDILTDYGSLSEMFEDDGFSFGEVPDAEEAHALLVCSSTEAAAHSLTEKIRHSRAEARIERLELAGQAEAAALCAPNYITARNVATTRDLTTSLNFPFQYNPPSASSSVLEPDRGWTTSRSDYGPDPPSAPTFQATQQAIAVNDSQENQTKPVQTSRESEGSVLLHSREEASIPVERDKPTGDVPEFSAKPVGSLAKAVLVGTWAEASTLQILSGLSPQDNAENECACKETRNMLKDSNSVGDLVPRERIPCRIAGDDAADIQVEPTNSGLVGVWRSVEPQTQNVAGVVSTLQNSLSSAGVQLPGIEPEVLPFLLQQLTPVADIVLEQALSLLESQRCVECGAPLPNNRNKPVESYPGMSQPLQLLLAPMSASAATAMLNCDVLPALLEAFGRENVQGPLTAWEWCHGSAAPSCVDKNFQSMDPSLGVSMEGQAEPVTPPQGVNSPATVIGQTGVNSGAGVEGGFVDSPMLDSLEEGESGELGTSPGPGVGDISYDELALAALPTPSILVGYQEDWIATSPSLLALWDKAPLEPYSPPKPILYYALCPQSDSLLQGATHFFNQLGTMYEACRLGTHSPATSDVGDSQTTSGKVNPPGLMQVTIDLTSGWKTEAYGNALRSVCNKLDFLPPSNTTICDGDFEPCMVVYVICPFTEPAAVLQFLSDSASALRVGTGIKGGEDSTRGSNNNNVRSRVVLQLIPMQMLLPGGKPWLPAQLREIVFSVYTKARRTALGSPTVPDLLPTRLSAGAPLSIGAQWKDCSNRSGASGAVNKAPSEGPNVGWLYEPLYVLAKAGQVRRGVGVGEGMDASLPSSPQDAVDGGSSPAVHCCYTWGGGGGGGVGGGSASHRFLLCVWTDARGELLEAEVLPGVDQGLGMQRCFSALLSRGVQLIRLANSQTPGRRLVIVRLGSMSSQETREWHSALRSRALDERPGLVCVLPQSGEGANHEGGKGEGRRRGMLSTEGQHSLGLATGSPAQPLPVSGTNGNNKFLAGVTIAWLHTEPGIQFACDSPSSSVSGGGSSVLGHKWVGSTGGAFVVVPSHIPRHSTFGGYRRTDTAALPLACAFLLTPNLGSSQTCQQAPLSVSLAMHYMPGDLVGEVVGLVNGKTLARRVIQTVTAELHGLCWLSLSSDGKRLSTIPVHCRLLQRLQGLLDHLGQTTA